MHVCICSDIKTAHIDEAIKNGCKTPTEIHIHCGTQPKCCKCFKTMRDMVEEHCNDGSNS